MALVKTTFAPGIDKQTTTYGAEGRWVILKMLGSEQAYQKK